MRRKVFVAAALFVASCSKQKQVEPVIQVVRAGVVEEIRPGSEERYSVSIEPFDRVDLAFKSPGIIQGILQVRGADGRMRNVQAGDKVARNTNWPRYVRSIISMHSSRPRRSMRKRRLGGRRRRRNGRRRRRSLHGHGQTSTRPKLNMYARLICSNRRASSSNSTTRRRDAMKPIPQL